MNKQLSQTYHASGGAVNTAVKLL